MTVEWIFYGNSYLNKNNAQKDIYFYEVEGWLSLFSFNVTLTFGGIR